MYSRQKRSWKRHSYEGARVGRGSHLVGEMITARLASCARGLGWMGSRGCGLDARTRMENRMGGSG